ncbi:hypothetical protein PPERSA_00881 [Pseudocohnilembus persalinus]|uniref:Uncharacterized protein n=1 Tax=Pseudocohnilembus persalinus TaxID=266149 RepID=A0A0V0QEK2_PSEPJ|nr:hypothetical protein PPERSA_00881 [Pseudocohnilembus persalinus]|eukprot:KRX00654.1 hypothetical protein PPERSA_00881 [Pseudocohnilembus persalinus]
MILIKKQNVTTLQDYKCIIQINWWKLNIFNNYIVSSSEDEFDIPVNTVDHENQENDLTQNYKLIGNKVREIDGESSQFDLLTQNNRLQQGFMNQQKVKANKNIRMIADQQRELQTANEYYKNYEPGKYKITQKNRDDFDPVQRQSHLSINRNPNNFQKEDGRTLKLYMIHWIGFLEKIQ